ncbi:ABC transporter substrate-binding protein [Azorhizobium doebereinerae]|uniref:ABC transporter substrate-binding protein n=1 Tax=Azorhizobium doebereinerae TaxID=281091 RepID=UPI00048E60D5|nr:ABC transporter substrate-binding protein [Azorhizobium doebereinerae]
MRRITRVLAVGAVLAAMGSLGVTTGAAQAPAAAPPPPLAIHIGLLTRAVEPPPLYDLKAPPDDEGLAGARLAIKDNVTTGAFIGQDFALDEAVLQSDEDPVAAALALAKGGAGFIAVNLPAADLLKVADALKPSGTVVFNIGATDDALRGADCRANLFHVAPSRAMLADALVQYLATRKWTRLFLVTGPAAEDALYAAALKHAAAKFGVKVVAEKPWTFGPLARQRGDTPTQADALVFTRGTEYDVLVVADEAGDFGDYIPYHTEQPKLVAGTQALVAATWHPAQDAWGSAQLQSRFLRLASRTMTQVDYQAWLAVRLVGEAATRLKSADAARYAALFRGPDFSIAAFKGVPVSFRAWDQQLRQPLLIAQPSAIVSVSPQDGYLHRATVLDTLGTDAPETACKMAP